MNSLLTPHNSRFTIITLLVLLMPFKGFSQDSLVFDGKKAIQLKEVIVRQGINVPAFMQRVQADTSFYKAFRNLRVLSFTAQNDIRLNDKRGNLKASLKSKTRQSAHNGCRWMKVLEENTTGDFYDRHHDYNYYTAELYAGLFFAKDTICGENNIVKGKEMDVRNKSGLARHKEQLKMLFFNPGKKIPGIPFIGNKINIFDDEMASLYDFSIDYDYYNSQNCYKFSITSKPGLSSSEKDGLVIDEMITWFNSTTMEVMGRNYHMSYDAGVYDFDVSMEVQMTKVGEWMVPSTLRYVGNWDVMFKKRERAVFTAVLYDFVKE